jgi:catechol 2,3-dioxygenase-like lactoylglutathione lyase family enzyme
MRIRAIDHVQLAMPPGGEDDAVRFYEGVLGLARVPKPAVLATRGGCWFEDGEVRVHLGVEPDFRPARKAHPGLLVDDLPRLLERLAAAGILVTPGDDLGDGSTHVYVDDPFGNRIELFSTPER